MADQLTETEKYLISTALEEAVRYLDNIRCRTLLMSEYVSEFDGRILDGKDKQYNAAMHKDCLGAIEYIKGIDLYSFKLSPRMK